MFDSKHEKDVSQKLTSIGDGLKDLMYEVRSMGNKISNSIQELSYVTYFSVPTTLNFFESLHFITKFLLITIIMYYFG